MAGRPRLAASGAAPPIDFVRFDFVSEPPTPAIASPAFASKNATDISPRDNGNALLMAGGVSRRPRSTGWRLPSFQMPTN
jgi:hypothetical protein